MTIHERHSDDAQATSIEGLLRDGAQQVQLRIRKLRFGAVGAFREPRSKQLSRRKVRWRSVGLVAAAFALVAGGAWLTLERPLGSKVSFEVQGAELNNPNYVVAPLDATAHMKFSDGSSVDLVQSTRLRVQQVTPQGAVLELERGTALTHVTHHAKSNWKLLAGPFEISVVGTRFQTQWDPTTETLQVDLYEGTVQIGGHRAGESAVLKNGQRFRAVGRMSNWSISPIEEPSGLTAASTPSLPLPALSSAATPEAGAQLGTEPSAPRALSSLVSRAAPRDWASAVAKGNFTQVVAEAESRGISACLDQCSIADLRHLADAARYTRRFDLSEQTLMALRHRAPGEAPNAAYLLGALNESQGRSMAALKWYFQCATEAPRGRYVSEAQAGRMRMLVATQQRQAAREAAERYLQDYPHGVGEATARKILNSSQ